MSPRSSRLLLAVGLSVAASAAAAGSPLDRMSIASGFWSWHTGNRDRYEQDNAGWGVEAPLDGHWTVAAGSYANSVRESSSYLQAVWSPQSAHWNFGSLRVNAGMAFGLINGYPKLNSGKVFPTLLPVASVAIGKVGLNFAYVPTIDGRVDGAFAVQFKVRVDR